MFHHFFLDTITIVGICGFQIRCISFMNIIDSDGFADGAVMKMPDRALLRPMEHGQIGGRTTCHA